MIEGLQDLIKAGINKIVEFLNGIIKALWDALNGVLDWFVGLLVNLWNDYLFPWVEEFTAWAEHLVKDSLDSVIQTTGAADWLVANIGVVSDGVQFCANANGFVPLAELVTAIGIIFGAHVVALGVKIVVKVVRG